MVRCPDIEAAIDRARNRLDAIEAAEGEVQTAAENLLRGLQHACRCGDKDRVRALEEIWESLADMTSDVRSDLQREISQLEQDLSDVEYRDLRRSSPVTL